MLFWILLRLALRKERRDMAVIYATLIVKGKKTFAQVPNILKEQVKQILMELDLAELAE